MTLIAGIALGIVIILLGVLVLALVAMVLVILWGGRLWQFIKRLPDLRKGIRAAAVALNAAADVVDGAAQGIATVAGGLRTTGQALQGLQIPQPPALQALWHDDFLPRPYHDWVDANGPHHDPFPDVWVLLGGQFSNPTPLARIPAADQPLTAAAATLATVADRLAYTGETTDTLANTMRLAARGLNDTADILDLLS